MQGPRMQGESTAKKAQVLSRCKLRVEGGDDVDGVWVQFRLGHSAVETAGEAFS